MRLTSLLAGIVCGLLGFAANWFRLELFFNVDYLFGSIFVMLAIGRFGLGAGLVAGAIAGSCTILLWHHYWAFAVLILEALTVGWLVTRRRMPILTAAALYWLLLGAPLNWLAYAVMLKVGESTSLMLMLKQASNGFVNGTIAQLLLLVWQARSSARGAKPGFRQLIFAVMVGMVQLTALPALVTDMRGISERYTTELGREVRYIAQVARSVLANEIAENLEISTARLQKHMYLFTGIHDLQLTILERTGKIVVSTRSGVTEGKQFSRSPGSSRQIGGNVVHWVPASSFGTSSIKRWEDSLFITEEKIGKNGDWRLVVEASPAELFKILSSEAITDLLMLLSLSGAAMLISWYFSYRLVLPLDRLRRLTQTLPECFTSPEYLRSGPDSRIRELADLADNFQMMTRALAEKFSEQAHTYEELLSEIAMRQSLEQKVHNLRDQVEQEERSRIARDLHDGVCQALAAIGLNMQMMQTDTRITGVDLKHLQEATTEILKAGVELREVVNQFRPAFLESMTLDEAICWVAERQCQRARVTLKLTLAKDLPPLASDVKYSIFRIYQEAVGNALRHASPKVIRISLVATHCSLVLEIGDDGKGGVVWPAAPAIEGGHGLAIMHERAEIIGAIITINSPPGGGTNIRIEAPLL